MSTAQNPTIGGKVRPIRVAISVCHPGCRFDEHLPFAAVAQDHATQ